MSVAIWAQTFVIAPLFSFQVLPLMPSQCAGTFCTFGPGGGAQFAGKQSVFCSICHPSMTGDELSASQKNALLGRLRALSPEARDRAFEVLRSTGALFEEMKARCGVEHKKRKREDATDKGDESTGKVPTRTENDVTQAEQPHSDIVLRFYGSGEMLYQGRFGLCSAYAVAVGMAGAIQCRYGLWVEGSKIIDRMIDDRIPTKGQWPHDLIDATVTVRVMTSCTILGLTPACIHIDSFGTAARAVHRFAGFRCVVVVAKIGESTHSMVAIAWEWGDAIVCQNSWGLMTAPSFLFPPRTLSALT